MSQNTRVNFYPSVRAGYRPESQFTTGSVAVEDASTATIDLTVTGEGGSEPGEETASMKLRVYGPGEVRGLDEGRVVRVEPEPDTSAFPPNYFPLVEFDRPGLPWLFSPQQADTWGRNVPWLCLVCVPVEQATYSPAGTGPSPVLEVPTAELPPVEQAWAWAHAQVLGGTNDPEDALGESSPRSLSRLVCPRNLAPNTKYRAALVPTFEPGRRAGLGLAPFEGEDRTIGPAWSDEDAVRLPVYYSWEFTSAAEGDFESLVRELSARKLGPDVGFRNVDVSNPGPEDLKIVAGESDDPDDPFRGTVGMGGALKAVGITEDPYDADATETLRDLLNHPGEVAGRADVETVGPPLYGQWHAGIPRLEPEPEQPHDDYYYPTWFNQLNVDPRFRVAAGFGTLVVQEEQERLMASAWEQFGRIQAANRKLRRAQLAKQTLSLAHARLDSLPDAELLAFASPVDGELFDEGAGQTVAATKVRSDLSTPLTSTAFRRATRRNGPLARREGVSIDARRFAELAESGAIPRLGDGLATTGDLAGQTDRPTAQRDLGVGSQRTAGAGDGDAGNSGDADESGADAAASEPPRGVERARTAIDSAERHCLAARDAVEDLDAAVASDDRAAVDAAVTTSPTVDERSASVGRNTLGPLARALEKVLAGARASPGEVALTDEKRRDAMRDLHRDQRRQVEAVRSAATAVRAGEYDPATVRQRLDAATAALSSMLSTLSRLRRALEPRMEFLAARSLDMSAEPFTPDLGPSRSSSATLPDLSALRGNVLRELDPAIQLPDHVAAGLDLPLFEREDPVEEVLASPRFAEPTYELLADLDQEYFLPGVGEIPKNTIGVLETNPRFVESFLAGLNHELSRELRWRKFPTDRKGTYFRRFWDRKGPKTERQKRKRDAEDPDQYADITPMHTWDESELGDNSPHGDTATVVLLIRGELLKRYPNTDVFAAKAVGEEGDRVPALPNTHVERDDAGENVKFPTFRGTLDPDVTFFGFEITTEEALYDPYHDPETEDPADHDDEGWFFVLQEPPQETRFGLDVNQGDVGETPPGVTHDGGHATASLAEAEEGVEHGWAALSWGHLVAGEGSGAESDGPTNPVSPSTLKHVDVEAARPGAENWAVEAGESWITELHEGTMTESAVEVSGHTFTRDQAATWKQNSAHMAQITWQRPVRVSIHADDMLPDVPLDDGEGDATPYPWATVVAGDVSDAGAGDTVRFDEVRRLAEGVDWGDGGSR